MIKSKAFELLGSFSRKELNRFEEFLNSPYHNKSPRCIQLFELIKNQWPELRSESLTYMYLHKEIFGKIKFNEATIRNLLSDLLEKELHFLAADSLKNSPLEIETLILRQLDAKGQDKLFAGLLEKYSNKLQSQPLRNDTYHHYKYEFSYQKLNHFRHTHHEYSDYTSVIEENEKALSEHLAIQLGNFYAMRYTFGFSAMNELKLDFHRAAMEVIDHKSFRSLNEISIFSELEKMHSAPSLEAYLNAKKRVAESEQMFSEEEVQNFYILLHNFILDCLNRGETEYNSEYNSIINIFMDKKYGLNADGTLSQPFYRNAVQIKVRMNDFEDAKRFAIRYKGLLQKKSAEDNFGYCMAYILFNERNYSKSLSLLSGIKFDEYLLKMQTECLSIMNIYELNMSEVCIYKIDTFNRYIQNNKNIPPDYRRYYTEFNKVLSFILKKWNGITGLEKEIFRKDLEQKTSASKSWLVQKINELENKTKGGQFN